MKKYVETEKLKEQLKLEAGLGHVQTLADVEKIIDFCGETLQQPQGIDKDRLIEELGKRIDWVLEYQGDNLHRAGILTGIEVAMEIINQQPYKESEQYDL